MTKAEDIIAANAAATQFELEVDSGRHPELILAEEEDPAGGRVVTIDMEARGRETVRRMKEVLEARGWFQGFDLDLEDEQIVLMTKGDESLVIHNYGGQVWIQD